MDQQDPSQLRISDDDRHRVAEFLKQAAGDGRIDLTELDERLGQTYAAKTYADLVPITLDLPTAPGQAVAVPAARGAFVPATGGARYDSSLAILSSQDRKGSWEVGSTHTAFGMLGSITLDLREAHFSAPEVVINANTILGSISVVVNAGTRVVVEGAGIMGTFTENRPKVDAEITPGSPLVRVRGLALLGSVDVTRKPMPGERSRRRLGR
ncbi:DUF1707 domain-containing protein [Nocardioides sp. CER19]|uniref:DUF1707 SHOCT-like domain-containing protein n=1 Tax=Nocardioides sp. CER19 TaxID=3038538 RepID=UPI002449EA83|nr:DUF1707 domain-containing protein [Nocardioides sp. CER19]MDH2414942.1 DUF1707 domain-containing protein [Nocardioides sp. CER19]